VQTDNGALAESKGGKELEKGPLTWKGRKRPASSMSGVEKTRKELRDSFARRGLLCLHEIDEKRSPTSPRAKRKSGNTNLRDTRIERRRRKGTGEKRTKKRSGRT